MTQKNESIKRNQLSNILRHTICWLLFIIYELSVFYYNFGRLYHLAGYLIYYCCNICLFYSQIALLNFTLNGERRRYLALIILFSMELIVFLSLKLIADYYLTDFSHSKNSLFKDFRALGTLDFLRNIYYIAFGTLYWTINNINNYQRKADVAEIDRLKNESELLAVKMKLAQSENAYLQQQMNPHMLFNSLNFIHSTVYKISHEAAENVILLSDILRFSIEETDADGKIQLSSEAEQIENMIKINAYRFDQSLRINYIIEGDLTGYKIIPLVLMTLTENIFKHGDLQQKEAEIKLSMNESGTLRFFTRNYKRPVSSFTRMKSTGLENIRIRLNYAYNDNYRLVIHQTNDQFESELTIQI